MPRCVLGIHHGENGIQPEAALQVVVHEESLGDGRGVGKSCRLDEDRIEAGLALEEAVEDADEIAAD